MKTISLFAAFVGCEAAPGAGPDYATWDRLLKRHLNVDGELDGIKVHTIDFCGMKNDREFPQFLESLADADTSELSKNETYALYINAYNALAVNMIFQHPYPAGNSSCITQIGDIPDVYHIPAGNVGGKQMALQDIENLLRDPTALGFTEDCRVHGCLVCMGVSCPNLRAEAYVPERIDEQMDENMFEWLANDRKGVALTDDTLSASLIFKWYDDDFKACGSGPTAEFIARYAPQDVAEYIAAKGADQVEINFWDYDHHLCGSSPCSCSSPPAPPLPSPAACAANPGCAGLVGNCCPADDGMQLACCSSSDQMV